ncbi:hypothetical protein D3C85_998650 [compost metagenome]
MFAVKTGVVYEAVLDNKVPAVAASYHLIVSPASNVAVKAVVVPLQIVLFPEIVGALYL